MPSHGLTSWSACVVFACGLASAATPPVVSPTGALLADGGAANDAMGTAMVARDGLLLIGARGDDSIAHNSGAVYCFQLGPDGYQQTSRGQYKEDLWLVENYFCDICVAPKYRAPTSGIEPGQRTFVEIGALDGRMYSNTFMFERHFEFGGLLIEGHPVNAAKLRSNRGVNSTAAGSLTPGACAC